MPAIIDDRQMVHTLINTFAVTPDKQDAVVASLRRFTESHARSQPGFVAASVHASVDGERVANYVQWRTGNDLAAMLATPAAQQHMAEVGNLAASVDPVVYEVVYVGAHDHEAP